MTETKTETKSKANLKLAARGAAVARLIHMREDEFHRYMTDEYKARGLTYERPLTEAEKAQQAILAMVEKYGSEALPDPEEIKTVLAAREPQPEMVEVTE